MCMCVRARVCVHFFKNQIQYFVIKINSQIYLTYGLLSPFILPLYIFIEAGEISLLLFKHKVKLYNH